LPNDMDVRLQIYDLLGRKVRTLVQQEKYPAGHHTILWDGRDDFGKRVSAGVYLVRFKAGEFSATRKLVVLK